MLFLERNDKEDGAIVVVAEAARDKKKERKTESGGCRLRITALKIVLRRCRRRVRTRISLPLDTIFVDR